MKSSVITIIILIISGSNAFITAQSTIKKVTTPKVELSYLREWFVSAEKGNDNNTGKTINASFQTLKKAATLAEAGDIVWIGEGIYMDTSRDNNSTVLSITQSGREDAWITWKALPGQHPELRPFGWNGIHISGSYNIIDGLSVVGGNDGITLINALADGTKPQADPKFNTNGIFINGRLNDANNKPHHNIIRNCSVSKCPGGGFVAIETDYVTIEDCLAFENAWYMRYGGSGISTLNLWAFDDKPGYHIIIQRNLVWNNKTMVPWEKIGKLSDGNGIILDVTDGKEGATNPNADAAIKPKSDSTARVRKPNQVRPEWKGRALVANNICAYNGGSGIHTFRTKHVDIINNTTYWNGQVVGYQELFSNNSEDIVILNNIIVPRPNGQVTSNSKNKGNRWDYNLYPKKQNIVTGPNDIIGDPLFINIETSLRKNSFRLNRTSPAINTGTNEISQPTDIGGTSRPAGIGRDRGAYEQ